MWLPPKGSRVVVAMSGGVDSSVAAAWLKRQGFDVVGVCLQLHDAASDMENKYGTCCTLSDIHDARTVAQHLEIPFYVTDMENEFRESVINDFLNEYIQGKTPNPCVRCNEKVKFSRLLEWAMDLGADYLATGHYARVVKADRFELHQGTSAEKDQSYFLFSMREEDLARCVFPMGGFTKERVRALGREYGLNVANKPDSQEICFVQGKTYQQFVEENTLESARCPGPIVDEQGRVLGQHKGVYKFTIGQRKGLGLSSPQSLFVVGIDSHAHKVIVGPEESLFRTDCLVERVHWINSPPSHSERLSAKIRYRASLAPCQIAELDANSCRVQFSSPQRAVTPGQAIVFYEGTRVVGGGWAGVLCA